MSTNTLTTPSTPSTLEVAASDPHAAGARRATGAARTWLRDTWLVMTRELRPVVREPFSLVFGLVQPLVFLALFGPLLVGAVGEAGGAGLSGADVWQWFVPAVLAMIALFGTSTTGANLQDDMRTGAHERMLVTPLSRTAQLVGRSLKEVAPLLGQTLIVVLVMLPFGFRMDPVGGPLGLAMLALFGVGLGSLSYAPALAVKNQEWMFWAVQQTFLFPLLILSGMLLPLDTGPRWMQLASAFDPLRWVVEA